MKVLDDKFFKKKSSSNAHIQINESKVAKIPQSEIYYMGKCI